MAVKSINEVTVYEVDDLSMSNLLKLEVVSHRFNRTRVVLKFKGVEHSVAVEAYDLIEAVKNAINTNS